MGQNLDRLEADVARAVEVIAGAGAAPSAAAGLPAPAAPREAGTEGRCRELAEEVALLRRERGRLRERIRGLIREIDRAGV